MPCQTTSGLPMLGCCSAVTEAQCFLESANPIWVSYSEAPDWRYTFVHRHTPPIPGPFVPLPGGLGAGVWSALGTMGQAQILYPELEFWLVRHPEDLIEPANIPVDLVYTHILPVGPPPFGYSFNFLLTIPAGGPWGIKVRKRNDGYYNSPQFFSIQWRAITT